MSDTRSPATHVLESTPDSVSSGVLDPGRSAALTIESGDVVSYPNTWTQWANRATFGMSFADREPLRRQFPSGPYSNLGPVENHPHATLGALRPSPPSAPGRRQPTRCP